MALEPPMQGLSQFVPYSGANALDVRILPQIVRYASTATDDILTSWRKGIFGWCGDGISQNTQLFKDCSV